MLSIDCSSFLNEENRIPTFYVDEWMEILRRLPNDKPSKRIITSQMGKRAIKALREINVDDNESWYSFLRKRSTKCMGDVALFYRGTKISFKKMFNEADKLYNSLCKTGLENQEEIGVCVSNTPELVYILLAANRLNVKVNLFGANFDKQYLKEILNDVSDKVLFISDDNYILLKDVIKEKKLDYLVVSSLADSISEDYKNCDEYVSWLDSYYHFDNFVDKIKKDFDNAVSFSDFIEIGLGYENNIVPEGNLESDFLISYTSGSTKVGFPKAIIHRNRSLITMGKFHDPYLSGNPKIPGLRGLAHIHPESNTDVITCISDNLIQGWSVALEPLYDPKSYLDYVFLNKPNYLNGTTSFNIEMAKQYLGSDKYKNMKMPFLFALFCVGEATSPGEEKYINIFLKKAKAGSGISIRGLRLPYTTVSIGGGDCEHGGVFYTLWKSLYQKLYFWKLGKESLGMFPVPYVVATALRKNNEGEYEECSYGEMGILVSNSYTNLSGYKNNYEATNKLIIEDNLGRKWVTNTVKGYIDVCGAVHQKGRISDGTLELIEPFMIDDLILDKSEQIMSSTTVEISGEYISTIQCFPYKEVEKKKVILEITEKIKQSTLSIDVNKIFIRIIDSKDSYPLTVSGKRDVRAIEEMRFDNSMKIN